MRRTTPNRESREPKSQNRLNFVEPGEPGFEPENIARQVKPMRELLDLRTRLSDLAGSLQGNERLERLLQDLSGDEEKLKQLRAELAKQTKNDGGSDG